MSIDSGVSIKTCRPSSVPPFLPVSGLLSLNLYGVFRARSILEKRCLSQTRYQQYTFTSRKVADMSEKNIVSKPGSLPLSYSAFQDEARRYLRILQSTEPSLVTICNVFADGSNIWSEQCQRATILINIIKEPVYTATDEYRRQSMRAFTT